LKKAAKEYGIDNPKIYTIASKFALLHRDDVSWDSPLDNFKNKFIQIFSDIWEEQYIKYLGIENLEQDINNYINTSVKEKILKIALDNIFDVQNDEFRNLNEKIQIFTQPKEEAEKNVNKALEFLDGEAKVLEENIIKRFKKSGDKYSIEINNIIDSAIENTLISKVDDMSKIAIAYAEAISGGDSANAAKKFSKSSYTAINLEQERILELAGNIKINMVLEEMQNYIKILFEEYKNNYLDVKTDLKNSYSDYEREIAKTFRHAKESLNSQLQDALDIDIQTIEMQTVDIDSTLTFEVAIPDSVLDYKYQKAEYETVSTSSWWNPFSWGDTERVKTKNEKHTLIINPLDLKNAIEKNMNETIEHFSSKEKENYTYAITELRRKNSDIFQDFRINKQNEIDKLQEDIKSSENKLIVIEKQLQDFNQLTKE
jgi:hypothetical protein